MCGRLSRERHGLAMEAGDERSARLWMWRKQRKRSQRGAGGKGCKGLGQTVDVDVPRRPGQTWYLERELLWTAVSSCEGRTREKTGWPLRACVGQKYGRGEMRASPFALWREGREQRALTSGGQLYRDGNEQLSCVLRGPLACCRMALVSAESRPDKGVCVRAWRSWRLRRMQRRKRERDWLFFFLGGLATHGAAWWRDSGEQHGEMRALVVGWLVHSHNHYRPGQNDLHTLSWMDLAMSLCKSRTTQIRLLSTSGSNLVPSAHDAV